MWKSKMNRARIALNRRSNVLKEKKEENRERKVKVAQEKNNLKVTNHSYHMAPHTKVMVRKICKLFLSAISTLTSTRKDCEKYFPTLAKWMMCGLSGISKVYRRGIAMWNIL